MGHEGAPVYIPATTDSGSGLSAGPTVGAFLFSLRLNAFVCPVVLIQLLYLPAASTCLPTSCCFSDGYSAC